MVEFDYMCEDITRKRYFAIREYPLKREDFEVEDMFPDGYTRTGVGLQGMISTDSMNCRTGDAGLAIEWRICQMGYLLMKTASLQG
jgi:hypothetical protein